MTTLFKTLFAAATIGLASFTTFADSRIPEGFAANKTQHQNVNLEYVRDGGPGDAVILLHGWPQTWQSWHKVMTKLSKNHDVIAVNLRGIGNSDAPTSGYDKKTMAKDILDLMKDLDLNRVHLVGHDVGAMVAFAFAQQWPEQTRTVTLLEAPIPGTEVFDNIAADPRAWHFSFHGAAEVPEQLTQGNESYYYGRFLQAFDAGMNSLTQADIEVSVEAYSVPTAATAGFNWYRTFAQDKADNQAFMQTPLTMPVLALTSQRLAPFPYLLASLEGKATNLSGGMLDSGHWLAEAVPEVLSEHLVAHFAKAE